MFTRFTRNTTSPRCCTRGETCNSQQKSIAIGMGFFIKGIPLLSKRTTVRKKPRAGSFEANYGSQQADSLDTQVPNHSKPCYRHGILCKGNTIALEEDYSSQKAAGSFEADYGSQKANSLNRQVPNHSKPCYRHGILYKGNTTAIEADYDWKGQQLHHSKQTTVRKREYHCSRSGRTSLFVTPTRTS